MKKEQCFIGILAAVMLSWGCSDPCEDVSCANGGVCVDGNCSCAEGWTGDDCTEPIETVATGCGDLSAITFDGHSYDLVQIGSQCWFAENLRSDKYRNGDSIPGNLSDAQWTSTFSGAQTVYGEGTSFVFEGSSDEVANLATYGRLYNWYAVNDSRGLCPSGFHVPSDVEWTVLEDALGGSGVAGTALKAASPAWDGTNSSGFSALPGGSRHYASGNFLNQGNGGFWWSSSPNGTYAWYRNLYSGSSNVLLGNGDTRAGFSVRCVRD